MLKPLPLALCAVLAVPSAHAEGTLSFSTGMDYSSGKYGESSRTETLSIPFGAKYETDDWALRVTVPYIHTTGPANVSGSGTDRVALTDNQGSRRTVSGVGDIVVAASWSLLEEGPWLIELGTKAKLATADETQGLGTGKNDYAIQGELYRSLKQHTLFTTLGFKKMGDPSGTDLKDPFYGTVGWSYRVSPQTAFGASYDYRQKLQDSGAPLREATGFLSYKLDRHWKLQTYVVAGFSKASPDLGGGMFVFYIY